MVMLDPPSPTSLYPGRLSVHVDGDLGYAFRKVQRVAVAGYHVHLRIDGRDYRSRGLLRAEVRDVSQEEDEFGPVLLDLLVDPADVRLVLVEIRDY